MERNHEDDGPTYALSAGAKRIESGLVLINALVVIERPDSSIVGLTGIRGPPTERNRLNWR
jgi:hypothetical protein